VGFVEFEMDWKCWGFGLGSAPQKVLVVGRGWFGQFTEFDRARSLEVTSGASRLPGACRPALFEWVEGVGTSRGSMGANRPPLWIKMVLDFGRPADKNIPK